MKTFYQRWLDCDHGYTNLGSFQTSIFKAYQVADLKNKARLEIAFPQWFTIGDTLVNATLTELIKVLNDPTYGDQVWRLAIIEKSQKIIDKFYER